MWALLLSSKSDHYVRELVTMRLGWQPCTNHWVRRYRRGSFPSDVYRATYVSARWQVRKLNGQIWGLTTALTNTWRKAVHCTGKHR